MDLGAPEIVIIAIMFFVLIGYKKLPEATRSVGRSLRIFKAEMKGSSTDGVEPPPNPPNPHDAQGGGASG